MGALRYVTLAVALLLVSEQSFSDQEASPKLQVAIIAVTDFADPSLRDTQLINGIQDATKTLKKFFETKLHVSPVVYTNAAETSSDFLKNWLYKDLRRNSTRAIHLVFVLTHGFADKTEEPGANKSELFLATSDTCKVKTNDCNKTLFGSSLRAGEFIDAFRDMPKYTTVFFFIDSCGSGAINSENLQKTLKDPELASRLLIFASALANESAYSARFTKALTKIWDTSSSTTHCGRREIEKFVKQSIKEVPGVSADSPQTVRLLAPLMPDFCIESFNYNNRFLFLFNAAPGPVRVTLQHGTEDPDDGIDLDAHETAPLGNLKADVYTMVAKTLDGDASVVRTIDLNSSPADLEVLFSSDPIDRLATAQKAALYLDTRGVLPSVASSLRQEARTEVENQEAVLRPQQLSLADELLDAFQGDAVLSVKLEEEQKNLYVVLGERDRAVQQLKSCTFIPESCSRARERIRDIDAQLTQIELGQAKLDSEKIAFTKKVNALRGQKQTIDAKFSQLESLQRDAADFDARKRTADEFTTSLKTELLKSFKNVTVENTRVIVRLKIGTVTKTNIELQQLVQVLNSFPRGQVEIEVTMPGKNSAEEQLASWRAAALRLELQQMGLKALFAAPRGSVLIGAKVPAINIIVSALPLDRVPPGWVPCNCPEQHFGTGIVIDGVLYHSSALHCDGNP